jgi:alpha-glucosidase
MQIAAEKFAWAWMLVTASAAWAADPIRVASPDGKVVAAISMAGDRLVYSVSLNGQIVLRESRLGVVREDEDFSRGLTLLPEAAGDASTVQNQYELPTIKRRVNSYSANRQVIHLAAASGKRMDVIFQVSNDGVAFCYHFPQATPADTEIRRIKEEVTSFHMLAGTTCWLQPMQKTKTGFEGSNPAYEEYYQKGIAAGTPSPVTGTTGGVGWVFPALFRVGGGGDYWVLLSEAALGRTYCGTHLRDQSPDGEYAIALADPREVVAKGPALPEAKLPWTTPWRIIAVGSLKTLVESTLGTDLADPPAVAVAPAAVKPGKSSWSWPLLGDNQTRYDTQKRFIDYAADMHWQYCLIDALWDKQIGYDRVKELADYAATKNVGVLLWYNSAGDWNTTPQTPRDKMATHESRIAEFTRLKAMGIKGVKIDFFPGDGQSAINYYLDILEDAAPFGLLMNFHGATLPRGWQRTYPHLMTMEAIKGMEFITFEQRNADQEPEHAAMLPFSRNVFDPMDFTPVCLDRINARIARRTTSAFELATAVIFTSGIQHYVEIPEGMAKMPDYVQEYLRHVPAAWDDTKFIDGFPAQYVVLARQGDKKWYLAGINAASTDKQLTLDVSALSGAARGTLITDGEGVLFQQRPLTLGAERKLSVTIKPRGGFVAVLE